MPSPWTGYSRWFWNLRNLEFNLTVLKNIVKHIVGSIKQWNMKTQITNLMLFQIKISIFSKTMIIFRKKMSLTAIIYKSSTRELELLDQRLLPTKTDFVVCKNSTEVKTVPTFQKKFFNLFR